MEISGGNPAMGSCKPCLKGKRTHEEILKMVNVHTNSALNHAFSDVCGPSVMQPHNTHSHLITLIDNNAREAPIHGPHNKSQVGQALKAFIFWEEWSTRQEVKILRSNSSSKRMVGHLQEVPYHTTPLHDTLLAHALDFLTPEDTLNDSKPDVF